MFEEMRSTIWRKMTNPRRAMSTASKMPTWAVVSCEAIEVPHEEQEQEQRQDGDQREDRVGGTPKPHARVETA